MFRAVHSERYPICLKKSSVQTVWVEEAARQHWVLPGPHYAEQLETERPGEPVRQETRFQKDLSTAKYVGIGEIIHKIH